MNRSHDLSQSIKTCFKKYGKMWTNVDFYSTLFTCETVVTSPDELSNVTMYFIDHPDLDSDLDELLESQQGRCV